MKSERLFLKNFVSSFYEKSRKVRTPKNASIVITYSINDLFKKYLNLKYEFEKEEVEKAFKSCGFEIMGVKKEEVPREFWDPGNLLFASYQDFINIKSQTNVDLSHTWKWNKANYSTEKKASIEDLRIRLDEFWGENKNLMADYIKQK
jgi:hypothetical protein